MFKVIKHIHPQIFDSMFVQYKNIHNYGTRHAELYCTPLAKTNLMRNSLRCAGVIFWNKYAVLRQTDRLTDIHRARMNQWHIHTLSHAIASHYIRSDIAKCTDMIEAQICLHIYGTDGVVFQSRIPNLDQYFFIVHIQALLQHLCPCWYYVRSELNVFLGAWL
jgi:hypothetical protein